jgi:hypothetical protein
MDPKHDLKSIFGDAVKYYSTVYYLSYVWVLADSN